MRKPTCKHTQVLVIDENSDTIVHTFIGYIAIECLRSFKYINSQGEVFDGSIHSDFGHHEADGGVYSGTSIYTATKNASTTTKWLAFPDKPDINDMWCSNNCTNQPKNCPNKLCYSVTFDSNDQSTRKQQGQQCIPAHVHAYMYEYNSCEPGLVCSKSRPGDGAPGGSSPPDKWTCQSVEPLKDTERGLCSWDEYSCWKATAGSAKPACQDGECCKSWMKTSACEGQEDADGYTPGCLQWEGCDQSPLHLCTDNKCNLAPPGSVKTGVPLSDCEKACAA
jgi:hypothetical protein